MAPEIISHLEKVCPFTPFDVRWIPSSARFVAVGCDATNHGYLGVYEMSRGAIQLVHEEQHPISLRCATFGATSMTERHLATGDFNGGLRIWDLEKLDGPVAEVQAHREIVNCIDGVGLNDGGSPLIATGSRDGSVKLWDPRQPSEATASIGPKDGDPRQDCWAVAFPSYNSEERLLASSYDNGDLKLFDLRQMSLLWEKNVKHGICSLEFNGSSSNVLVATTANAKIHVCHVDDLGRLHTVLLSPHEGPMKTESGHKSTVWSVSHLPQSPNTFMTSGANGNLNLWSHAPSTASMDASEKVRLLTTASISNEAVCRFTWHPDKTGLGLATSFDKTIRIIIVTRLSESEA